MIDENNLAEGLVCEWFRLSLSLPLPTPFLCQTTLLPGVGQRQEGKQTEIKETLVLFTYLVKIWRKEGESEGSPKILPQFITCSVPPGYPAPHSC